MHARMCDILCIPKPCQGSTVRPGLQRRNIQKRAGEPHSHQRKKENMKERIPAATTTAAADNDGNGRTATDNDTTATKTPPRPRRPACLPSPHHSPTTAFSFSFSIRRHWRGVLTCPGGVSWCSTRLPHDTDQPSPFQSHEAKRANGQKRGSPFVQGSPVLQENQSKSRCDITFQAGEAGKQAKKQKKRAKQANQPSKEHSVAFHSFVPPKGGAMRQGTNIKCALRYIHVAVVAVAVAVQR